MVNQGKQDLWLKTFIITVIVLMASAMLLNSGCQTVDGIACDVEWGAKQVQKAARPGVQKMEYANLQMEVERIRSNQEHSSKMALIFE